MKHCSIILVLCVATPAWTQSTDATLDKMIATGKSPQELAAYLFDTHGCKNCHTAGNNGKLGFTKNGEDLAKGFQGCIANLKAVTVIAKVPLNQRSETQRKRVKQFEDFGCSTCHMVADGKVALTAVGAKLAHLHVGCVEVQKVLAGEPARQR